MPNLEAIKEAIESCKSPIVMVALSKGEVASRKTELAAFTNNDGFFMVSNVAKLHSLYDGKLLAPVESASKKEVSGEAFESLDDLVTMQSKPLDGTEVPQLIGVDADVAFALVGEEVFCPITGKPTKLVYKGEVAVDGEEGTDVLDVADENDEDDAGDDSSDDDITDVDDSDAGDSSDDDSDEEEVSDDDLGDSGEEDDGDDEDASEEAADDSDGSAFTTDSDVKALLDKYSGAVSVYEDSESEDPSLVGAVAKVLTADTYLVIDEDGNAYTVKATETGDDGDALYIVGSVQTADTASEQEVFASETVEQEDPAVRLVNIGNGENNEVAVFAGTTHIATLYRNRASETAAPLFADGSKLFAAFRPTLKANFANQKSSELAKFGYVPVTFKIKTSKLFAKRLEQEVAKVAMSSETASATKIDDFASNIELAFVAINKGAIKVDNVVVTEVAALLKRNGVVNAELEVRKLLAKHAKAFVQSAIEQAKVLNTKSADYLTGFADSVAKAEFVGTAESAATIDNVSTAFLDTRNAKPEVANFKEPSKPAGNKYASVVASLGRRTF